MLLRCRPHVEIPDEAFLRGCTMPRVPSRNTPPSRPDPVGAPPATSDALCAQLEALDRDLLALLARRTRLAAALLRAPVPPSLIEGERLLQAVAQRREWGAKVGLDRGFVETLFSALLARDLAVAAHAPPPAGDPPRA